MRITDIKQQVKNKDRYSVYVDGDYAFSLSADELVAQKIASNQEITKEQLETLIKTAVEDKAYQAAIDLIARRPRSIWEMQQYLARKQYDQPIITKILNKLISRGLLNDKAFAEAWVQNRQLLKPTSRRKLQQELQQKNISKSIISEVLADYEDAEQNALKALVEKKRPLPRYQDQSKLMAYLVRQGFSYGDIKAALSDSPED